jgi:hypothetical protein
VSGAEVGARAAVAAPLARPDEDATLVDLLDRVIDRGVVVQGDVVLSVAGVDLVHLGLQLVLRGVDEPGGVR